MSSNVYDIVQTNFLIDDWLLYAIEILKAMKIRVIESPDRTKITLEIDPDAKFPGSD